MAGSIAGAGGAIVGAFGGYNARVGLVRALRGPDFVIAIPEDGSNWSGLGLISRF